MPSHLRHCFVPSLLAAALSVTGVRALQAQPVHLDALAGAGALRSTAADMLTFLEAQLDTTQGPLARAIPLGRAPRAEFGSGARMALGWLISGPAQQPFWWHNGGTGGFRSFAGFDPARQVGVVVLANAAVSADDIGVHLLNPQAPLQLPPFPPRR